jgi:hypothetical protein
MLAYAFAALSLPLFLFALAFVVAIPLFFFGALAVLNGRPFFAAWPELARFLAGRHLR